MCYVSDSIYIKCMCVWLLESEGSISISTDPKLSTKNCEKTCIILESLINCVFIPKNMWVENIDVGRAPYAHAWMYFSNALQVCWKCEATKGNTDMTNAYTDVAEHAPWKATLWTSLPWPISEVPELTKVTGFDVKMISADLLHTWHLGCGRDLAGSCIKVLVGLRYFHGRSIERSLAQATVQLKRFAKLHKHSLVLRKLTKANLNWSDYPELRCKGFDTFVVLAWLQHEFSARPPTADDPELQSKLDLMTTAVWCMDSLMRMLAHSGMHLSEMQQRQKTILGSIYMNCYMTLAQKAIEDGKKLWRVRPKIHILHHCILEDRESRLNPHYSATWMDEDFVKRTMRVKKKTHKRTATCATLCRWLMGLPKQMQLSLDQL